MLKLARKSTQQLCQVYFSQNFMSIIPKTAIILGLLILSSALVISSTSSGFSDTVRDGSNGPASQLLTIKSTRELLANSDTDYPGVESETAALVESESHNIYGNLEYINERSIDHELCSLSTKIRHSLIAPRPNAEVTERILTCSQVNKSNYRRIVENIFRRDELDLQQIQITDSESFELSLAIDLICGRFNCSKLTVFNVTGQKLHDHANLRSWIRAWPELEILDLSQTSLTRIESLLQVDGKQPIVLKNLTVLHLDNNNINELNFDFVLDRMPNLKRLSLVNNTIFNINCSENLRSRLSSQFESINLAGNFINCDKSQLWFMKKFVSPITNLKFPEHDKINCSTPERLLEMNWSQRVSVLETRICDDCDCRSLKRTAISVDCHNKNLTALPDILPLNTKILNLTSNHIDSLGLSQNSKNWENVTYVYLQNNLLTSFQPLEMNSMFLKNLAALDIRGNKFQEFPSHIFEQFINLDQVHLSNNPWVCDCESTFAFQEWLQRQFHKVGDKEEIKCGSSGFEVNGLMSFNLQQRLSSEVIYRLSKAELCPQENNRRFDLLDALNYGLGLIIVLTLLKVIADYIYQHRTKQLPHFFKLNF